MMHSFLSRSSLREYVSRSISHRQITKNVAHRAEWFQTATGSEGSSGVAFGGHPVTKSLSLQIINALQLGDRNKASSLLVDLSTGSHAFTFRDYEVILEYCAKTPDPVFVVKAWEILEERHIGLTGKCYLDMVRALCNGGYLKEAFHLVKFLRENNRMNFVVPIYNCILSACVKMQDVSYADQCLDLMENQMVGKNEVTYSLLLTLAVGQRNQSAVDQISKEFAEHYDTNMIFLQKLVWSYSKLMDLESAYKTLQHMIRLVKKGSLVKRSSEGRLYCPHLDIPIPQKLTVSLENNNFSKQSASMDDDDTRILSNYPKQCAPFVADIAMSELFGMSMVEDHANITVRNVLRWSFDNLIYACGRAQNSDLAEQLIVQMRSLGIPPSRHTYDGFIKAVISDRGYQDAIEVLKVMQQGNFKPFDSTLATVSVGCSRALNLNLSEFLLGQISQCSSVHPFNTFLEACDKKDQPECAIRMFAKMKKIKVKPNIRTYELLFSLFGNVNAPYEEGNLLSQADAAKRITTIERDMMYNGIEHSLTSMRNLLKALGSEGMVRELMEKLHMAEKLFSLHDTFLGTDIYNIVLHSLVDSKESHIAIELFRSMKRCGYAMDAATYNVMIDCCSNIRCFKSALALVSLMVRDGFNPRTPTYTALIKILLDHDDFDGALNLLDQAVLERNELDVLFYNTFLSRASIQGRIDIIELITEHMHQHKIRPDPTACHYVFSGYVDCEFFSTGVEALQVLSMRMISIDDADLQEGQTKFESLILSEDPEAEKRIVQLFHNSMTTVAAALLNLRWCAMIGFSIPWDTNQSPWARRLQSTYNFSHGLGK